MKIQFLGHSCFYVEENNFKALIDPFMTGNESCPLSPCDFSSITHIFVTHGHTDHLGDTLEIAKKNDATVITNYEIACFLKENDVNAHPMHIGGRTSFDFGVVKMTPALHGSSIQTKEGILYGGNPCGFVIEVKNHKIYHAGDTGLTMDMKLLEIENIDVALLPIGGNFTMDIQDASLAVDFIKPKKVIPMHYNTFPLIQADPLQFKTKITSSEVIILNPGQTYML
ncbi:metal-dependent hydrolase [Anaerophilus nitritogenes]|uniref:metal-dependent hydrolase n=1 Tax=Anaerophilus nitritogenes TaxID=2498136 RepID=UPI00101CD49D|nr:metal-dependent hydrolase [Anaerophilus nitritogenes]